MSALYVGAISASLAIGTILVLSTTCFWLQRRKRKAKKRSEDISEEALDGKY